MRLCVTLDSELKRNARSKDVSLESCSKCRDASICLQSVQPHVTGLAVQCDGMLIFVLCELSSLSMYLPTVNKMQLIKYSNC